MKTMSDLNFSTVRDQRDWVVGSQVTSRELVEHSLAQITRLDPALNAFSAVLADEARADADRLDAELRDGSEPGPLHGVPIAVKDENDVRGVPTAYGGASVTTPAAADSEVVRRLRDAGAVIIGKTRMPEFGIWPYTETAAHGWTRNPWDLDRSPAGSSGGTAAAVASGMVAAGIGGDGGGSIRLPSSWCGLFGLKPQRGRVSTAPNRDLWRALGTLGPLTRTVADSALIYDVISGTTSVDRFHAAPLSGSFVDAASRSPERLRIRMSTRNPAGEGPLGGAHADAESIGALHLLADRLRNAGHTVVESDPDYPLLAAPFSIQVATGVAEEAARVEHPALLEQYTRRIARVGRVARRGVGRAEQQAERTAARFLDELFAEYNVLLTPTTPTTAVPVGQLDRHGFVGILRAASSTSSFTSPWNVLGNPAAAVPIGLDRSGLPQSAQLVGPAHSELLLVSLCAEIERIVDFARHRPRRR